MVVRVQTADFLLQDETNAVNKIGENVGALVTFTGLVRQDKLGKLSALELEHYPGMSEQSLKSLEDHAKDRWSLQSVCIIHRYGVLKLGEQIMMVAVSAAHRGDAFAAAEFLMDHLKNNAPFWKKEHRGVEGEWISQNSVDVKRLQRWG